jgi:beta-1,4-mannosyl-glycoprotein beta-1,4-N-acetylglucosaminyltransferase
MLDVRFNILNEHVDKFIVAESKFSHSGKEKPLNFNINNFPKFKDKIQYLVIENEPDGINKNDNSSAVKRMNSLLRINQSYDFMMNAIKDTADDDLICLSDNDEIPNFNSEKFKKSNKEIFIFKQLFFYYKFNLFYDLMPWYGTKACKKKKLVSLSWLRNLKNKQYPFWRLDTLFSKTKHTNLQIVENGGWHFTNLKTAEEIHTKLSNFGHHNEFDASGVTVKDIQECIDNRIVNYNHQADQSADNKYTANYKLKLIEDKILPKYLINNKQNLKEWFD